LIVAAQQKAPTIGPTKNKLGGIAALNAAEGKIADARQINRIGQGGNSPSFVVAIRKARRIAATNMDIMFQARVVKLNVSRFGASHG